MGGLGITFPFVLVLGAIVLDSNIGIEPTISDYYDTVMIGVFVGVLFAIGVFLFSYQGYDKRDNIAGYLACVFAIGVALFPSTADNAFVQTVHFVSATALFLTLAYFSFFLFTKSKDEPPLPPQKAARNRVYRTCGIVIVVSIALIGVYNLFLADTAIDAIKPVFILETLALEAFGISWVVKGEALLGDEPVD